MEDVRLGLGLEVQNLALDRNLVPWFRFLYDYSFYSRIEERLKLDMNIET